MSLLNPPQPPAGMPAIAAESAWFEGDDPGIALPSTTDSTGVAAQSDPQPNSGAVAPFSKSRMASDDPTLPVSPCGVRVSRLDTAPLSSRSSLGSDRPNCTVVAGAKGPWSVETMVTDAVVAPAGKLTRWSTAW